MIYSLSDISFLPSFDRREKTDIYRHMVFGDKPFTYSHLPLMLYTNRNITNKDVIKNAVLPVSETSCEIGFVKYEHLDLEVELLKRDIQRFGLKDLYINVWGDPFVWIEKTIKTLRNNTSVRMIIDGISHPLEYLKYARMGVDMIVLRNIGNIRYPLASFIKECYDHKRDNSHQTKIVVRLENENIEDIIKCFVLGADYVLLSMNNTLEMLKTKTVRVMNKYIKATTLTKMLSKDKFFYDQYGNHLLSFNDWISIFKKKLKETMCETGASNLEEFKNVERLIKNKENI